MKPLLKFVACILLAATVAFVSCSKDSPGNNTSYIYPPPPPPPPPPPSDSLNGTEIIFNNLIWETGDFFGLGINDVFVGTPARPDLFSTTRRMEVSIKLDSSLVWINTPYWTSGTGGGASPPLPPINGYTYEFFDSVLYVFAFPLNYQLTGTRVSIKVKFL